MLVNVKPYVLFDHSEWLVNALLCRFWGLGEKSLCKIYKHVILAHFNYNYVMYICQSNIFVINQHLLPVVS